MTQSLDLGQIGGLMTALFMGLSAIAGAMVWFGHLSGEVRKLGSEHAQIKEYAGQIRKDYEKDLAEIKKELSQAEMRIISMEDHKTSVAVLGSQMTMVLERISELSRDVKNLLDGHARLTSGEHK